MKISNVLTTLKENYINAKGTPYEDNQKLYIEMGWAIRRLNESGALSLDDDFNDEQIKAAIFNEMNFDKINKQMK